MHDWLVWALLEVAVPAVLEMGGWPRLKFAKLILGRPDLDTSINTVSGQWASSLQVPFLKDT